ncbi:hypothetical protein [Flagellimonas meishanensis]|uniref:hypothetical protein n=1 Tax=Flagellimonas meishanensis TaxID=2873264 RepID=UPI001CA72C9B|nr:hypothetical protein [[Muricauda] meishanensis]
MTSYVSSYSFATHAMLNNFPLPAIQAMPGHSKLNTTHINFMSFLNNAHDAYQETIKNN